MQHGGKDLPSFCRNSRKIRTNRTNLFQPLRFPPIFFYRTLLVVLRNAFFYPPNLIAFIIILFFSQYNDFFVGFSYFSQKNRNFFKPRSLFFSNLRARLCNRKLQSAIRFFFRNRQTDIGLLFFEKTRFPPLFFSARDFLHNTVLYALTKILMHDFLKFLKFLDFVHA